MALSGSISSGFIQVKWTATQNKTTNKSTIKATFQHTGSNYGLTQSGGTTVFFDVMGVKKTVTITDRSTVISTTSVVTHNADGKKSFYITASYSNYASGSSDSVTKWWALNQIPRAAEITDATPNFTDEANPVIYYKYEAGDAASSLQAGISFTGENVDIPYRDIPRTSGTYTFNLTENERNILRAGVVGSNTRTLRFYIRTILNGEYHFSYKEATVTVINAQPTIDAAIFDTNPITIDFTDNDKTLIRYASNVRASMNAYAYKQATIKSYSIEHNGINYPTLSQLFNSVESNVFTFKATDSRGNTVEKTIVAPMLDYIKLTCNMDDERPSTEGIMNLNCSGNYYNDNFEHPDNPTATAKPNTLVVQYRYKLKDGDYGNWTPMEYTLEGNSYRAAVTISGLDYRKAYVFQCQAIDVLTVATTGENVLKTLPIFDWGENDFQFNVPVHFVAGTTGDSGGGNNGLVEGALDVTGDCVIQGNLRLKGDGNYGNTLYFGDGGYASISEPSDDTLDIKATNINLKGNVNLNGEKLLALDYGDWTPALNGSAVSSYTVRQGWFQKVGNTVTVGFHIKATCNSGYESSLISISGLPFNPEAPTSGGGMCSGAYVSSAMNFQCWVADTSRSITPRVQACNNTSAKNLSTSASGCYYPKDGGELTLSGTLCFSV